MPTPAGSFSSQSIESMTATWTDPTGAVWPLTSKDPAVGMFTTAGPAGWGAIKYEIVTDPASIGGETVRFIRAQPGRLTWPLHINGEDIAGVQSPALFQTRWRAIRRAFTMTLHLGVPGTLQVSWPDGTVRQLDCFLEDGFGGESGENHLYANPILTLYAPDGYWRDPQVQRIPRVYTPGSDFFSPFPTVSTGQILGRQPVLNPGDVVAWPSWNITGPASVVTAVNHTTNQSWVLTYPLAAGATATVNTMPRPTARGPAGENLVGKFNWPDAFLWPLLPGANDVEFTVGGAAAGTAIELVFQARYEGA